MVTSLAMPVPQDLPPGWAVRALPDRHRAAVAAFVNVAATSDVATAVDAAHRLVDELRFMTWLPCGADKRASRGNRDIDAFCEVQRVTGDPGVVLACACARVYIALVGELSAGATRLTREAVADLGKALAWPLRAMVGTDLREPRALPLPQGSSPPGHDCHGTAALRRWKGGHRLFMVLLQALIVTTDGLRSLVESGPVQQESARDWQMLRALLSGSTSALLLTGDFSGDDYLTHVRPLMSQPFLPRRLTGVTLWDHEHWIGRLRALGRALRASPGLSPVHHVGAAAAFQALDQVYATHRLVCARFVGTHRNSLIGASGPPAVAVIDRLRSARTGLLAMPDTGDDVPGRD